MKVGDLIKLQSSTCTHWRLPTGIALLVVRQAPNVFIDITVADKKMLVLEVMLDSAHFTGTTVRTLLEGKERVWHYAELEVISEAR